MWIDTSSPSDASFATLIFFGLTFLCLFAGFSGNRSIINHVSTQAFTPSTGSQIIHFDAAPISSLNRFLTLKVALWQSLYNGTDHIFLQCHPFPKNTDNSVDKWDD
jgi:hypothetical protein